MQRILFLFLTTLCIGQACAQSRKLPVTIQDVDSIRDVSEPAVSPDGKWVAYIVSSANPDADNFFSDIWMTSWDGTTTVQLTHTEDASESTPRWSPDNTQLAFMSSRTDTNEYSQIWVLNRLGGEAKKLTSFAGGVEDYAWSPDGKKMALVVSVKDTNLYIEGTETAVPIVIDRYYFKEDYSGYLTTERAHLYLLDMATGDTARVVDGDYEEELPSWSPDGKQIAFVSKRARKDWDRDDNYDVYIVDAKPHAQPRQLTTSPGKDNDPSYGAPAAWSPDGKYIAFTIGGPLNLIYYATQHLAVIPVSGGNAKVLTASYDRNVWNPQWSPDSRKIYFIGEDDQNLDLNAISVDGGAIEKVITGRHTIYDYKLLGTDKIVLQYTTPLIPQEIFVYEQNALRKLSHQNDGWLSRHALATTKEFQSKSKDGTMVSGFMVLPAGYVEGKKYPTILQIHGGPTSQNQNEWAFDWQLYASWGYVTVSMNPRGSTTKGEKFALAIFAKWGSVDIEDNLSGVDYLVKNGIADPDKLAVEGWSYGGIATNFTIARDQRFKCAISGASIGNALAGYGTDMYIREYEAELGTPWKNYDAYVLNSMPFLHADKIKTPTLFMCGANDFNVPLLNSEQMYQALKSLGIETQLIIYPEQYHGIDIPSYQRDRFERRKDWLDAHLKK